MKDLSSLTQESKHKNETPEQRRIRVRDAARANGIWSFVELARRVGCSETSIHMALERPSRFSNVWARIEKLCEL